MNSGARYRRATLVWSMGSLICYLLLSSSAFSATQNFSSRGKAAAPIAISAPPRTLTVGEKLVFEVSWFGIPIGIGTLHVKEKLEFRGRTAFHVSAVAETNEFLSKLYPVRDTAETYIDAESFYSLGFRKTLSEGRYRADERIDFDVLQRKGFWESVKNGTKKTVDLPGPVHDFLSAFFWFRLQPITVGRPLRTVVNDEERNWDLELDIQKLERKEIKGVGTVDTVRVETKSKLRGMLYDRGRSWVYFTVDERRLPVWIAIKTPYGPVNAVLKEALAV